MNTRTYTAHIACFINNLEPTNDDLVLAAICMTTLWDYSHNKAAKLWSNATARINAQIGGGK